MIRRLSEVRDEAGRLTHQMCCICFEYVPLDQLWVHGDGQRWDMCVPCGKVENGGR